MSFDRLMCHKKTWGILSTPVDNCVDNSGHGAMDRPFVCSARCGWGAKDGSEHALMEVESVQGFSGLSTERWALFSVKAVTWKCPSPWKGRWEGDGKGS